MMNDEQLKEKVIEKLQTIYDPEIPVNIYDLGLIYNVDVLPINNVQITMTLTAPSCPAAQSIPVEVDQKLRQIEGVNDVQRAASVRRLGNRAGERGLRRYRAVDTEQDRSAAAVVYNGCVRHFTAPLQLRMPLRFDCAVPAAP